MAAVAGVLAGRAGHTFSPDAASAARLAGYFSILSDVFLDTAPAGEGTAAARA